MLEHIYLPWLQVPLAKFVSWCSGPSVSWPVAGDETDQDVSSSHKNIRGCLSCERNMFEKGVQSDLQYHFLNTEKELGKIRQQGWKFVNRAGLHKSFPAKCVAAFLFL